MESTKKLLELMENYETKVEETAKARIELTDFASKLLEKENLAPDVRTTVETLVARLKWQ